MAKTVEKKFLTKITPDMAGGVARQVAFTLGNGVKVIGDLSKMPADIVERLAIHGLSQKVGDSTSNLSKSRDFHAAFGAMQEIVDNLEKGLWSVRGGSSTSDLVAAMAELQGLDTETVQAAVDSASEEQVAELRKHPQIKAKILEMQAERQKQLAKANAEDMPSIGDMLKGIMK